MKIVITAIAMLLTFFATGSTPETPRLAISMMVASASVAGPMRPPALLQTDAVSSNAAKKASAKTIHAYIKRLCKEDCVDPDALVRATKDVSGKYKLSQSLLMAVVKVESTFRENATNKSGGLSVGLTQVQVRWHKDKFDKLANNNYFDVNANIDVGANVLKACMVKHKGDTRAALMCYSGYSNTAYPDKVLAAQEQISQLAWTTVRPADNSGKTTMTMAS